MARSACRPRSWRSRIRFASSIRNACAHSRWSRGRCRRRSSWRGSEAAIALYDRLFGQHDERTEHVRGVLQIALDQYREIHRAQRVVGFELRRFVKNRPSTLIEAYTTLEDLDLLFRYHRRLGLSPGEFKRIQRGWLEKIRPDGIDVDELAETIHPSRYVRGSDILDIFGQ